MRVSIKEFITTFGKWWWVVVVDYVFGVVGVYQTIVGETTLSKIGWGVALFLAFAIPPWIAFHKIRKQRDELRDKVNVLEQQQKSEISSNVATINITGDVFNSVVNAQVGIKVGMPMPLTNFKDMKLYVGELFKDSHNIDRAIFSNCEIIGPGMIGFDSNTRLEHCQFYYGDNFDDMLVVIHDSRMIWGGVGFTSCIFQNCAFKRVGFFASELFAETLRREIKLNSKKT